MHAHWTHPVFFHPNGGISTGGSAALDPKSVLDGNPVAEPPGMTRSTEGLYLCAFENIEDFTVAFGGWYDNPGFQNDPWNFSDSVTGPGPLDLYANWLGSKSPVDIAGQTGNNTLEKALNYINGHAADNYTIVLEKNISMASTGSPNINNANAVITLVGKGPSPTEISMTGADSLFYITAGKLALDNNITLIGNSLAKNASIGAVIRIDGGSAFVTMKDGAIIRGNTGGNGGGVNLAGGGTFNMYGGKITGNTALIGGGLRIQGSTFNMHGGEISGNIATSDSGGGVYIMSSSTFNMYGGKISGNTMTSTGTVRGGAGVYISMSSFKKTGGYIGGDNDTTPYTPQNGNGTQDDNTVVKANNLGHAVYYAAGSSVYYYRDAALEDNDGGNIDTAAEKPANSGAGEKTHWTKQ
jgi:hypothetical protein